MNHQPKEPCDLVVSRFLPDTPAERKTKAHPSMENPHVFTDADWDTALEYFADHKKYECKCVVCEKKVDLATLLYVRVEATKEYERWKSSTASEYRSAN